MSQAIKQPIRGLIWGLQDHLRMRLVRIPGDSTSDVRFCDIAYNSRLRQLFKERGINLVIDVGANAGQFAFRLRTLGYTGRIVSFEPAAKPYEEVCRLSARDPSWTVRRGALGREAGEMKLNIASTSTFNSLLAPTEKYTPLFESSPGQPICQETVMVSRLDDLWPEVTAGIEDPKCFLKVDTQGFDSEVFGGSEQVVLPACIAVQYEGSVEPVYQGQTPWYTLFEQMRGRGFKLAGFYPCATGDVGEVIELDCLMIRP